MPTLTLVPTPLGDPDDITLRALRMLREASAVAAVDFDAARHLLDAHSITTPLIAYNEALDALNSGDVALIARAGTPGIGDAAQEIVQAAIARGIRVEPLSGADAAITALVLSGLPTASFVYVGRLPDNLNTIAHERDTMIFTVLGLNPELERLWRAGWGDRALCVTVGLTQSNEIIYRGTVYGALEYFIDRLIVNALLVVAGAEPEAEIVWDESRVRAALRAKLEAGEPLKVAAKAIASVSGWDRRTVYALGVDIKK